MVYRRPRGSYSYLHVDELTSSVHEDFQSRTFFPDLDGLRAVAIIAVVWHHCVSDQQVIPILSRGFLGVDLFFVISGFLITTLLLRERGRFGSISLRNFYIRRFLRIFPPYYLMLAATSAYFVGVRHDETFAREAILSAVYLSNTVEGHSVLAITWSLSTEEQFYLLWPPVERFLPKAAIPFAVCLWIFNAAVAFGIFVPASMRELSVVQATLFPMACGVILAHTLHSRPHARRIVANPAFLIACSVMLFVTVNAPSSDIAGFQRLALQFLMTLWVAALVVPSKTWQSAILRTSAARRVGELSYGIYLYHMIGRHAAKKALDAFQIRSEYAVFLLCVIFTFIAAEISFRFFEKPILNLKSKFTVRAR